MKCQESKTIISAIVPNVFNVSLINNRLDLKPCCETVPFSFSSIYSFWFVWNAIYMTACKCSSRKNVLRFRKIKMTIFFPPFFARKKNWKSRSLFLYTLRRKVDTGLSNSSATWMFPIRDIQRWSFSKLMISSHFFLFYFLVSFYG